MGTNHIELRGHLLGDAELRMTPAGIAILRLLVDCSERKGELAMPVVITGDEALRLKSELRRGDEVTVEGTLKTLRRTLPSGMVEKGFEVMASSVLRAG